MAKAVIIIEDINLADGTVRPKITIESTSIDDGYVTAAHFFATHIEDCMSDPVFLAAVWAKAEALINDQPNASIANPGQRITVDADNYEAATKAA